MLEIPPEPAFYVWIVVFFAFAAYLSPLILKPTQEVLAQRAEKTSGAQEQARAMRSEVQAMGEEFDRKLSEARLAGASGGDQIRREAEEQERNILEGARADAASTLETIRSQIANESDEARSGLEKDARELAELAANKILGRAVKA